MAFCVNICIQKSISHAGLLVVIYAFVSWKGVQTWNYEYSSTNMTWPEARAYCQKLYTDLVAIQNQDEINHLNQVIPRNPAYYWIGIRKIAGVWTWVGTNKSLDKQSENWAEGEPTPGEEDCVEIYIKRDKDAGKWNNEPCTERQKRALCYLASCKPTSCGNGECVETIGNYTCQCNEGFHGSECEHAVRCDAPNLPANGYQNCSHPNEDFTFHSVCVYSCAEGFSLIGSVSQQCESSGKWSSPVPTCEAVRCDAPNLPANGYQNCSHPNEDFTFRSVCVYSCAEGFSLIGSVSQQCESSGKWSSPVPTCEAVRCDSPKLPANGYQNCSHPNEDFTFRSVCVYSCEEGFSLIGSVSQQCESSGKWSSPVPTCEAVRCDAPNLPTNGYQNCSHPNEDFTFRSVCVYSCAEGFSLIGSARHQCESSGKWSSHVPTCEAVRCDAPNLPANGYQNCSHPNEDFTFQSVCVYSCAEGFSLIGSARQQCESSGKWSSPVPTCEAVRCDAPNLPANGYQNCSHPNEDFTFRSVCVYSCAEGFSLIGSVSQQCESSGKWSSPVPKCEAVRCDAPNLPANGYQNCSHPNEDFTFRSVCVYSCAEGFSLIGLVSQQCESSGKWSSPVPTCEAVKCDVPKLPANGYQRCSHLGGNFTFRSVCVYSCAEGFLLNGLKRLHCDSSGKWSSPIPICEAVRCEVPKLPNNGYQNCSHVGGVFTFRSVCVYSCATGFSLNGSKSLQCDSSGRWSSPIPTCEDIQQYQTVTKVAIGTGGASVLFFLPFIGYLIKLYRRKAMKERLSL